MTRTGMRLGCAEGMAAAVRRFAAVGVLVFTPVSCAEAVGDDAAGSALMTRAPEASVADPSRPLPDGSTVTVETKWDLWSANATLLRGANIWQAVVIPELDGDTFKGGGRVGPPFSIQDFRDLAALGANYVSISGPGLFTEDPPYEADSRVVAHYEELLAMIAEADMFATIGFRTGPGRSEYSLCCGGDPYFDGFFDDSVWESREAQSAWVDMWRYAAEQFRDSPIVVGYKLMVEPNAAAVFFEIYDPEEFYPAFQYTSYDWNRFYPQLVEAIREVDPETPILVGAMGFSSVRWMPSLEPSDAERIVYVAHQYEPFEAYTHQDPSGRNGYPDSFDLDWDGEAERFDVDWLNEVLLAPLDAFHQETGGPIAIDEFGVNRWVPDGAAYMADLIGLFEARGLNHALWEWQTSWPEFRTEVNDMDFRLGPAPSNLEEVDNELLAAIVAFWSRNTLRPSAAPWAAGG